ncbi:MAG TPA: type III pantothenate kinase [Bellilinea sp.]|nr:type III pantothenate kinase [Bellilinea sp.]
MLLTIDVGNTNVTLGVYDGTKLTASWRLATNHQAMPDEYGILIHDLLRHAGIAPENIEGISLGSVVPILTSRLTEAAERFFKSPLLVVNWRLYSGLNLDVDEPHLLGADRIIDMVAVHEIYKCKALVLDFGTATTFDVLTEEGVYLGGAIAPGIGIMSDALSNKTASLPRVGIAVPSTVVGRNTVEQMQAGIVTGYVCMIEGMIKKYQKEIGRDLKVIATGGLAEQIAKYTNTFDIVAPWLTLDGLRLLWDMNKGKLKK